MGWFPKIILGSYDYHQPMDEETKPTDSTVISAPTIIDWFLRLPSGFLLSLICQRRSRYEDNIDEVRVKDWNDVKGCYPHRHSKPSNVNHLRIGYRRAVKSTEDEH